MLGRLIMPPESKLPLFLRKNLVFVNGIRLLTSFIGLLKGLHYLTHLGA